MTTAPTPALLPCPFCGAGNTEIRDNGKVWSGMGYTAPTSTSVFHHCRPVAGQPSRAIERVGRDRASAIAAWNQRADLEARKPLPLSYRAGAMTSSIDGGATVSLHFNDMAEAEAWFVAITDQHDAALASKAAGPLPGITGGSS